MNLDKFIEFPIEKFGNYLDSNSENILMYLFLIILIIPIIVFMVYLGYKIKNNN